MRIAILVPALTAGICLAAAATAGSPDNPGAGGQAVKNAASTYKDAGLNFGTAVSDFAKAGGRLGESVQAVKEFDGGDPNPANDNGGGND